LLRFSDGSEGERDFSNPERVPMKSNHRRRVGKARTCPRVPTIKVPAWARFALPTLVISYKLDSEIETAEREIASIVYRLFDLTPDEIALLEASIAGQI
jgi:hypothetical protein